VTLTGLSFGKISSRGHNYVILLDTSESMKGEKFDLMIKTAMEYIEGTCMIYILSAINKKKTIVSFNHFNDIYFIWRIKRVKVKHSFG
jgi:hypothetical protein